MKIYDTYDSQFVENLKAIKDNNGMSQDTLSIMLGVKRSLVGAWMEGRSCPSTEMKFKICKLFRVDITEMHLGRIENNNPISKGRPIKNKAA